MGEFNTDQSVENGTSGTVKEVKRIMKSRAEMIDRRARIPDFVEEPLIQAAELLYDRNIRTLESGANAENVQYGGKAFLVVEYETLSPENRAIAEALGLSPGPYDKTSCVSIDIPADQATSTEFIRTQATEKASQFKLQEPIWIPRYSLEEMKKIYGYAPDENVPVEAFQKSWFYDPKSKLFYLSQEHFQKVEDYKKTQEQ